jgi:hypothetical protein
MGPLAGSTQLAGPRTPEFPLRQERVGPGLALVALPVAALPGHWRGWSRPVT